MTDSSSSSHQLTISSSKWRVDLIYLGGDSFLAPISELSEKNKILRLSHTTEYHGVLKIDISDSDTKKTCFLKGVFGSVSLEKKNNYGGQSVKLVEDSLILSIGVHFVSINLLELYLNWSLQPDLAEVFEFYDLEKDYLLRGEIDIHRIDPNGKIKWSFSGSDIWVNMEGKREVNIKERHLELFDYNSKRYLVDFDGRQIQTS